MLFYFSATGNSKALAEALAAELHDTAVDITTLCQESRVESQESMFNGLLGFVFPIYGWSLPNIVRDYLLTFNSQSPLPLGGDGGRLYVFFAVTCGDDVGVADRPIRKTFEQAGLHLDAGYSVTMPDSYVCLPGFDVDKPEERERKLAQFRPRVREIAEQIERRAVVMDIHRGRFPWLKTNVLGWFFRKYLITDKPFRTTSDCISCGLCAKVCPMHNIELVESQDLKSSRGSRGSRGSRVQSSMVNRQWSIVNGQSSMVNCQLSIVNPTWLGHCTGCLACYHHCPTRAIRFGRRTEKKGQYLYSKYREP